MKNEIGRKITSLTLMTIMLAGGMTIAFPGFTPDAYAVNANLFVSAENTGSNVDGAQVVEILVIDDDLTHPSASPTITLNGYAVLMTPTSDGNWYAYVADTSEVGDIVADSIFSPTDHGTALRANLTGGNDVYTTTVDTSYNPGIDFGTVAHCSGSTITNSDAAKTYCADTDSTTFVVGSPKTGATGANEKWPFIQTYEFADTIEIQYNKAGGTQIATLEFEDNAVGLSLDRSHYPTGAAVHVTIEDHRLNIDPTSADIWTWDIENGHKYYGETVPLTPIAVNPNDTGATPNNPSDDDHDNDSVIAISTVGKADNVCADCSIEITSNRLSSTGHDVFVLVDEGVENRPLPMATENTDSDGVKDDTETSDTDESKDPIPIEFASQWFTVREIGGPNTAVFSATNLADESILKISDTAVRGESAIITYDGDDSDAIVQYSEATIKIQSPDDVWTSGLAIPIVIVDGDANKNSLSSNDVVLTDPHSIIPTLVTGNPFTLGKVSSTLTTWIVWNATDATKSLELLNRDITGDSVEAGKSTYGSHGATNPFMLDGFKYTVHKYDPDGDAPDDGSYNFTECTGSVTTIDDNLKCIVSVDDADKDNMAKIKRTVPVDGISERAILNFSSPLMGANLTDLNDVTGGGGEGANPYAMVDYLVIDFGPNVEELRRSLINQNATISTATGFNFLNYNIESLNGTATSLDVLVNGKSIENISLDGKSNYIPAFEDASDFPLPDGSLQLRLNFDSDGLNISDTMDSPIVIDFFSFGFENDGEASDERIANQIIRLLLEESGDDTASLEGTLEYIMINQLNIDDADTYGSLSTISDEVSFIVIEDLTGSSAPSVAYLDVDTTGANTPVSAQQDAPSHSAVVSLDVESFKAYDTVTVTLEDLDLNTDSNLRDIYTVVGTPGNANRDAVGEDAVVANYNVELGRLLDITFDDQRWMTHTDTDGIICTDKLNDHSGLGATGFRLVETGDATGIFEGTFAIPAEFCKKGSEDPESITGLDIAVNYVDFRDASGETTEVGDSAGIKASTGSVSLDRTVYPVPFGIVSDFEDSKSTIPAQSNTNTRSIFPIHQNGMNDRMGLQSGEYLPQGDLIVYVTVTDPDFDVSASGRDSIALDDAPVTVSVIRGSQDVTVAKIGDASEPIDEIAPDAGIFEKSVTIRYSDGPVSSICPSTSLVDDYPADDHKGGDNCILQGDILQVEYEDPTDASGQPNTVTDSATFDLRNGVLQSDKSVYIIGSDMILTLIEPDFDLDSSQNETYDLDLIKWSSSAATVTMGDAGDEIDKFDPEPLSFRETGPSTGIFQVVVEIPQELDKSSLQRGEEIDLEYTDWGPSGSDYVGDQDEDIRLTVFTSNFGATIALDQKVYSWTDKVYITVVAPDHNFDSDSIDEIGKSDEDPLRVATKGYDLDNYRLVETGFDTGIFTGEVILTGFKHDATGKDEPPHIGVGPTDGYLPTPSDGGISVSYEFSEDENVFTSSIIRWNIGDVQWLEASYPASATGVLRVIDPDMNLNPEAVDNFDVNVASNTDASGITLTVTETNEATGIFEGTIFFTTTGGSSGHRLRVSEGDTVTADYSDVTLPSPYTTGDSEGITSTTIIGTIVPPLERAPATSLRIVNTFGSSIDAVSIDQQVQITADLSNGQDRDQDFAYLIQIQNSEGVTVSLSWIAGSLSPGQSFSPSASWTPTSVGTYTVTAFVWESIDNPTALSPPLTIDVSVN